MRNRKTMTIGGWLVMGLNTIGDFTSTRDKPNL